MSDNGFHCLESVPKGFNATVVIDGKAQPMCCIGCQTVAENIVAQGMTDYYKFRTVRSGKVEQLVPEQLELIKSYDNEDIQDEFIATSHELSEVLLTVEGITCAACAWLIEKQLLNLSAIRRVDVNTSTNRAMIQWDKSVTPLSKIITALHEIG
jgi:Cu2+-exporting ATPase